MSKRKHRNGKAHKKGRGGTIIFLVLVLGTIIILSSCVQNMQEKNPEWQNQIKQAGQTVMPIVDQFAKQATQQVSQLAQAQGTENQSTSIRLHLFTVEYGIKK